MGIFNTFGAVSGQMSAKQEHLQIANALLEELKVPGKLAAILSSLRASEHATLLPRWIAGEISPVTASVVQQGLSRLRSYRIWKLERECRAVSLKRVWRSCCPSPSASLPRMARSPPKVKRPERFPRTSTTSSRRFARGSRGFSPTRFFYVSLIWFFLIGRPRKNKSGNPVGSAAGIRGRRKFLARDIDIDRDSLAVAAVDDHKKTLGGHSSDIPVGTYR